MNPDGTSVAYTSLTYSSTHFPSDGWVAMMQQGGTGGHNLTQEMATKFDFIFKIHKNLTAQADFGYKKGYLRNDYREMDVQYSKYPGEVETMTTNYSDSYREVVYDQNFYTAEAVRHLQKRLERTQPGGDRRFQLRDTPPSRSESYT